MCMQTQMGSMMLTVQKSNTDAIYGFLQEIEVKMVELNFVQQHFFRVTTYLQCTECVFCLLVVG
jgi:hypothetical protein